jgi:hypothetical protein
VLEVEGWYLFFFLLIEIVMGGDERKIVFLIEIEMFFNANLRVNVLCIKL